MIWRRIIPIKQQWGFMLLRSPNQLILLTTVMFYNLLSVAGAQSLSQCQWDLNQLAGKANQASVSASFAASEESNFENAVSDLKRCINYPDIYDLLRDGCSSKQRAAEDASRNLETALSSLQISLSGVNSALQAVSQSCRYNPAALNSPITNSTPAPAPAGSFPNLDLNNKELAALLAVGAIGTLVASKYGQDREPERLDYPNAPPVPRGRRPVLSRVVEEVQVNDSLLTGLPSMTTIDRPKLSDQLIDHLATLAAISEDSIESFRWGKSMAPKGNKLYGLLWYKIITADEVSVTLYARSDGRVIYRKQ